MKSAGAAAFVPSGSAAPAVQWPVLEGPDTPKICLLGGDTGDAFVRSVRQLGVNYLIGGGLGRIPWREDAIRAHLERLKAGGLTLYNAMIGGYPKTEVGQPGRDEEIDKVIQSIRAAGRAGLPVIEYTFQPRRAMEGYHELLGRAGAGHTGFDYERVRNLPPVPEQGTHTLEQMWGHLTYFLKAVVPVAQESGVRLAIHPNDPPAPMIRGVALPLGTVAGWKRLIEVVPSPSNGIVFDCGVTREMGEDPVEVCRYFASRDRINHVHFRNVIVRKPREQYTEVFIDEGQVNMFAVMKELVRNKYPRSLYPEHPRALDYDRASPNFKPYYPGGGGYAGDVFNVAYARAMLQAALSS
jgi:mannonate dehydratase